MQPKGIPCLICGKPFRRVCCHVRQTHNMTAREYKEHFGLDTKRGLLLPEDRERMREATKSNGTINNILEAGREYRFKKGHTVNYIRSMQTIARLKVQIQKIIGGRPPEAEMIETTCANCGKTIEKKLYYYQEGNNYCDVICRNRQNNKNRSVHGTVRGKNPDQ